MSLQQFISYNNIRQADAIVLRKKFLGMVDHYALFLGYDRGIPIFVANHRDGVKEIPLTEIETFLTQYNINSIVRFPGPESERAFAIQRAMLRIGENAYNIIKNNCESFKNWVHYGYNFSIQANNVAKTTTELGIATAILALIADNKKAAAVGIGLVLVGEIIKKDLI